MKFTIACMSLTALVGCGGPADVCQPTRCPLSGTVYQSCATAAGSVTYSFGASTCACNLGDTAGCTQCAQEIAGYCSGGIGGDGGVGVGTVTSGDGGCATRSDGTTTDQYVFDTLLLPQQRTDYAFDLTGSGHPVNQYAAIIGASIQEGADPQAGVNMALQAGQEVILLADSSTDASRQSDGCATATLTAGTPTNVPPTQNATYTTAGTGGTFAGPITTGTFDSASPATTKTPVSVTLPLPFVSLVPLEVPIVGAHLQFTTVGGRITGGQLNGAIRQSDIDGIVIPAMAQTLAGKIAADQASGGLTSTDLSFLTLFDTGGVAGAKQTGCSTSCATTCQNPSSGANACGCAVSGDSKIDECEVATNAIIAGAYAPDVQLFDADGNYAPNPNATHKDSLSIGLGFTAIPAHF